MSFWRLGTSLSARTYPQILSAAHASPRSPLFRQFAKMTDLAAPTSVVAQIGTHDGQSATVSQSHHPLPTLHCSITDSRRLRPVLLSFSFHCDEALACWLLRQTANYQHSKIHRTRDTAILDSLPIVVDVGATYSPATHRYDHHQRGFTETFSPDHPIKLSSAGLVYKHFGEDVIRRLTGCTDDAEVRVMWLRLYRTFIEAIDAIDNGISQYDSPAKPLYRVNTDLSARVGYLNGAQSWNPSTQKETQDQRFERASQLTGKEFTDALMFCYHDWLPARRVVQTAIERRFDVHPSGVIVRLDELVVWKSHIVSLEDSLNLSPQLLYVLYQDERGKWRVQCVPAAEDSFASRKALPESWRGIRDDALSALTGIPGCIFVHASGFIGGAETYESALALAVASWEMPGQVEGGGKKQKVEEMKL